MILNNKNFQLFINKVELNDVVIDMAHKMTNDLQHKDVIFLGILNGSFMFASDLLKNIGFDAQISFLKVASYEGTSSSGNVQRLIGVNEDLKDKTIIIVEDIVESGNTLDSIIKQLKGYEPSEIKVATLLHKPNTYKKDIPIDYVGFEISDEFIIGHGLDYNGYGRNYPDLYHEII